MCCEEKQWITNLELGDPSDPHCHSINALFRTELFTVLFPLYQTEHFTVLNETEIFTSLYSTEQRSAEHCTTELSCQWASAVAVPNCDLWQQQGGPSTVHCTVLYTQPIWHCALYTALYSLPRPELHKYGSMGALLLFLSTPNPPFTTKYSKIRCTWISSLFLKTLWIYIFTF